MREREAEANMVEVESKVLIEMVGKFLDGEPMDSSVGEVGDTKRRGEVKK